MFVVAKICKRALRASTEGYLTVAASTPTYSSLPVGTTYIYSSVLCYLFLNFKVCICLLPRPSHCSHWRLCLIQKCSGWNTPRYISFELLIQGEMYLSLSHLEIQTQVFALQLWAGILLEESFSAELQLYHFTSNVVGGICEKIRDHRFPCLAWPDHCHLHLVHLKLSSSILQSNPSFLGWVLRRRDGILEGKEVFVLLPGSWLLCFPLQPILFLRCCQSLVFALAAN